MIKICYINPTNNMRRPIAELANILAQEGHQMSIMYPESKDCPTENWVANDTVKSGKIKLIPIPSQYISTLRYSVPNFIRLWKEVKKIYLENDIIHIWEYYYPLSVITLIYTSFRIRNRRKIILTTDGFVGYSYLPKHPWWLVPVFKIYTQLFARFLFKIPHKITTYGNSMLPYARQAGVPMERLEVIPTGIHLERFENVDEKKINDLKKEFNVKEEKVILFVGMLTERKHPEIVIQVSQQLLQEGKNVKTLLVGDAHGKNPYPQMVKPEFKDKIIFTGGRKDIPELMKLGNVLLLPSEGEGLPGVVMEAMASGLPVVATEEGCTPDLIGDGKEGFLVYSGKKDEYYQKIKKIILGDKEIKNMKEKGVKKIKQFSWELVAKKYKELYALDNKNTEECRK